MRAGLRWCQAFDGPHSVGLVKVSFMPHPFFSSQTILVNVPETHALCLLTVMLLDTLFSLLEKFSSHLYA